MIALTSQSEVLLASEIARLYLGINLKTLFDVLRLASIQAVGFLPFHSDVLIHTASLSKVDCHTEKKLC